MFVIIFFLYLQSVSGLVVKELFLKRIYNFVDITQVFVTTADVSKGNINLPVNSKLNT